LFLVPRLRELPMRRYAARVTALALLALAATPFGVVRGTVTRSPTTPVCRIAVPCSAPAKHLELRFVRYGATVRTRTTAFGFYFVKLAPGPWRVRIPSARFGFRPRTPVLVRGRAITRHDLWIDTGIR